MPPSTDQPQRPEGRPDSLGERPQPGRSFLITAGPTHEPIDAVRYIGNRSSGRLGIDLASAAADRGWNVTLLLGPATATCTDPRIRVERFVSTADLERLLQQHFPAASVLVMAAAVADYRPINTDLTGKMRRSAGKLTLELESTPDLLGGCARARQPGQTLIGFALEPEDRLLTSAREKLERKHVDAIVANTLRTMDAPDIDAMFVTRHAEPARTPGRMPKNAFAPWLLDRIEHLRAAANS